MDSSTEVDYNGYLEWAQESLGVLLHFPLRMSPTAGKGERGVFCEDDIPAETIVVSVPWEVRMLESSVVKSSIDSSTSSVQLS